MTTTRMTLGDRSEPEMRKTEKYWPDQCIWTVVNFHALHAGDVFRLMEADGSKVGTFVATGEPYQNDHGVNTIACEDADKMFRSVGASLGYKHETTLAPTARDEVHNLLQTLGVCPVCKEMIEHDGDEPVASCACGPMEWAAKPPLIDYLLRSLADTVAKARAEVAMSAEEINMRAAVVETLHRHWVIVRDSLEAYGLAYGEPRPAPMPVTPAVSGDDRYALAAGARFADTRPTVIDPDSFGPLTDHDFIEACGQYAADEFGRDIALIVTGRGDAGGMNELAVPCGGVIVRRSFWRDDGVEVLQK